MCGISSDYADNRITHNRLRYCLSNRRAIKSRQLNQGPRTCPIVEGLVSLVSSPVSPPSCAAEALAMAEAAFDYLNSADLPTLPVATQAECLTSWARLEAKRAAAEAALVAAFWAADGP